MVSSLDQSYELCRQIARQTAKNFYYSFVVMPAEKQRAMCAIYAFMRRTDDIADGAANPAIASEGLKNWRMMVDDAFQGRNLADPILPALADTVKRYRIPIRLFHELLDGTEMDQTVTRYETFQALYGYCYRVASCVGLVVLPVFGYESEQALKPAEACGIAFQLTNIIRDVKEDARLGRIYLPIEDLRRFNVEERVIINGESTPQLIELLRFEADRAEQYYRDAQPLLGMIHADSRKTLAVMMAIYGGILRKIRQHNFAVMNGKIRLSTMEKMWLVAKHWTGMAK
jgi:phytoene synthase